MDCNKTLRAEAIEQTEQGILILSIASRLQWFLAMSTYGRALCQPAPLMPSAHPSNEGIITGAQRSSAVRAHFIIHLTVALIVTAT